MLWLILFAVVALFIYVKIYKPHKYWEERNVPHLKAEWPILGNMKRLTFRQTSFAESLIELCNQAKSRCFGFYQFLTPTLMVSDLEVLKQVAVKDFDSFLDHQAFVSEKTDPLFAKNLFSLKGQEWRTMRSTLSPAFTSSKMRQMFVLMRDCADDFTKHFMKEAKKDKYLTVEMKDIFTRFANDVIATCAFGVKCDSLGEPKNEFYTMGKRATDFTGLRGLKFFGYSISPTLMEIFNVKLFDKDICDFFVNLVMSTIHLREKQNVHRPDMINLLMEAKKGKLKYEENASSKNEDTGFATVEESQVGKDENNRLQDLTDIDLTAQALIFFFAGFDTTSAAMCHMANELAINPDIQDRLREEVLETLEECNGKLTYEAVTKMKYLDMVVSETLRKWPPPVQTDRLCTKTFTIQPSDPNEKPITLHKGDLIWIPLYAIHRDPEYYSDPERFDPERFNDENKKKIKPLSYIPFGLGPRNCIGSRFALLEIKTLFVYLLSRFDIVVDKKTQVPIKLTTKDFNMAPENGFWLGLKVRDN